MSSSLPASNSIASPPPGGNSAPASALPAISPIKGGGAIGVIGEKFSAGGPTGTATASIPFRASEGRLGFTPDVSLSYDSGSGSSPFGFGWQLGLPTITRKTDKGLPRYGDLDVFLISSAEDLVPILILKDGEWIRTPTREQKLRKHVYRISEFRPRLEGIFSRIEMWTEVGSGETHWRSISPSNVTSIYGDSNESRVYDPAFPNHVFSWLLSQTYDDKGNVMQYHYKRENSEGVDLDLAHELNRPAENRTVARYLKKISYGNRRPRDFDPSLKGMPWMFEIVFDYGDHHTENPTLSESHTWRVRPDSFSTYRAGFEIRTYRRCERILMFHHFQEEGYSNCLVASLDLQYHNEANIASLLTSAIQKAYATDGPGYISQALPPLEFEYSKASVSNEVHDLHNLSNLPAGVDGTTYQWLDLDSEGLPGVISNQAGTLYYKPNLGGGQLGSTQTLNLHPTFVTGKQEWLDLAGDGRLDYVQMSNTPGFYKRDYDVPGCWQSFREFRSLPNVAWNNPNLRLIDLTGDGLADVLILDDEIFTYFTSCNEVGFSEGRMERPPLEAKLGPQLLFRNATEIVFLADMSGDGMSDLVRIHNGEVCYWPNMGYARFGARVAMDNSPWFDLTDIFQQTRIRLADVDGSGTTDIVYLHRDGPLLFLNQAGNSWSNAHPVHGFPKFSDAESISVIDVLGKGTACLVWSTRMPGDSGRQIRYVDLMAGGKPYLLTSIRNNFGAETHIEYTNSTQSYLEDKAAGRPWVTRLPFPVHVVKKVTAIDRITGHRLATRYVYHDGFFDPFEREFRGFGIVETLDFEDYEVLKEPASNYDSTFSSPPALAKRWYDTGAYLHGVPMVRKYTPQTFLPWSSQPRDVRLPERYVPYDLTVEEVREAYRSLKGLLVREEIYTLDGTSFASEPYQVSEANYTIELLQPRATNRHAVFFSHAREAVDIYYERNRGLDGCRLEDPRITHSMVLTADMYGNILSSLFIAYGRQTKDLSPYLNTEDHEKQRKTLAMLTINRFTNRISTSNDLVNPLLFDRQQFEILDFREERLVKFKDASLIYGSQRKSSTTYRRRLLNRAMTKYRRNDLSGPLPFGQIESLAIKFESYRQAFTNELFQKIYVDSGKLPSSSVLEEKAGYVHFAGAFWEPSGHVFFSPTPQAEAEYAAKHFYLPHRFRDPLYSLTFDTEISITYDKYDLLPVESKDAMGNLTTVGTRGPDFKPAYDYRLLKPTLIMDANRNQSAFSYDVLGMLTATATMGKPSEDVGDLLSGFDPYLTEAQKSNYFDKPLELAAEILGNATTRMVYDYLAYYRTATHANPQPATSATIKRDTHVSDLGPGESSGLQSAFLYADGSGRAIQTKNEADSQWVASGWTIFNNKGSPVKKYEPLFTTTHRYQPKFIHGVSQILLYDPLQRVAATLNPDHSWSKVIQTPWTRQAWDSCDTILLDPSKDIDVGGYFRRLERRDYSPSWYDVRVNGQLGHQEKSAAQKAANFAATPSSSHLDPLARTIASVNQKSATDFMVSRSDYDFVGNVLASYDPLGRTVDIAEYDLLQKALFKKSMETDSVWTLFDALNKPWTTWESRGFETFTIYDRNERPVESYLRQGNGPKLLVSRTQYGEQTPDGEATNSRTRISRHWDQAQVKHTQYNFQGNPIQSSHQVVKQVTTVDWSSHVPLEEGLFGFESRFDAFSRLISTTQPDGSVTRRRYNKTNQLKHVGVNLKGEWQEVLVDAEYNAKNQRVLYRYGNGTKSRWTYDPLTFALRQLVSLRDSHKLQDLAYTYDPMRNITHLSDGAQPRLFFRGQTVDSDSDYTYDALYRLLEASGREHLGQTGSIGPHDEPPSVVDHPNNPTAMSRYTETYSYDDAGNILQMRHRSHDPTHKSWTRHYSYNEYSKLDPTQRSNRLSATRVGDTEEVYRYEGNEGITGNITHMAGMSMHWDFRNQLLSTTTTDNTYYTYADGGQRMRKQTQRQNGNRIKERIYFSGFEVFRQYNGDDKPKLERHTLDISDASNRIALIETLVKGESPGPPVLTRYQLGNHLGSAVIELDDKAKVITYEEYYPFGSSSYRASHTKLEAPQKRYRYAAKEHDDESGLYYYGLRYYASWIGRWINPDPGGTAMDGPNLFQFCHGNPISLKDPDGGAVQEAAIPAIGTIAADVSETAPAGEGILAGAGDLLLAVASSPLTILIVVTVGVGALQQHYMDTHPEAVFHPIGYVPAPAPPYAPPAPPPPQAPTIPDTAPPPSIPDTVIPIPVPTVPDKPAPCPPPPGPKKDQPQEEPPNEDPSEDEPPEEDEPDTTDDDIEKLKLILTIIIKIVAKLIKDEKNWDRPQWHHTIPQKFRERMRTEAKIDIDEAQYGRIIPTWMHNLISNAEDKEWNEWAKTHPVFKKEEVLAEMKRLDEKYYTNWLYAPTFPHPNQNPKTPQTPRGPITPRLEAERDRNGGYFRPPP